MRVGVCSPGHVLHADRKSIVRALDVDRGVEGCVNGRQWFTEGLILVLLSRTACHLQRSALF